MRVARLRAGEIRAEPPVRSPGSKTEVGARIADVDVGDQGRRRRAFKEQDIVRTGSFVEREERRHVAGFDDRVGDAGVADERGVQQRGVVGTLRELARVVDSLFELLLKGGHEPEFLDC